MAGLIFEFNLQYNNWFCHEKTAQKILKHRTFYFVVFIYVLTVIWFSHFLSTIEKYYKLRYSHW